MTSRAFLFACALAFTTAGAQQPDTAKSTKTATTSDSIFTRARQLVLEGSGPQGRAIIDSVLAQTPAGTPQYAEALYWRALLASNAAEAERDYRHIIVEYPLSERVGDALFSLSQLEMARGDREGATAHLQRFMLEHPESPDRARAGLTLSRLLIEQGRLARGCATLARTRSSVPADAVELKNQFDYYDQRCSGVDTVEVAAAPKPAKPTAPSPAVAPPTKPSSGKSSTFTIQVAAVDTKLEADQLAARLTKRGLTARVYGTARPFRVRIGRFNSQEAAADLLQRLRADGVKGFITVAEPEGK